MLAVALFGMVLAVGPTPDGSTLFAPNSCSFAVDFPVAPLISKSADGRGDHTISAEFIHGGARYSAACISAEPYETASPPAVSDVAGSIEKMANSLGIRGESLHPLQQLGRDCEQVDGSIGPESDSYRISATICVLPQSTFIAEVVYPGAMPDAPALTFLNSITTR